MDSDIASQIQRAKKLLQELKQSCEADLKAQTISEDTKNLPPEIISKMRVVLDQAMEKFFSKNIAPNLSPKELEKAKRNVSFPLAKDKPGLESTLRKAKMENLAITHFEIHAFLDSVQPYNVGYEWLNDFSKLYRERHIIFSPQERIEENETTIGTENMGVVHIGPRGSVKMKGCLINGIPVNVDDLNTAPLNSIDPRLKVKRTVWVSFNFQGTSVNILWLCEKAVNDIEKILEAFFQKI